MEIRRITREERDQFILLDHYSYGQPGTPRLNEVELEFADPSFTLGAFDGSRLVAGLRNLPLRQSIRGVIKTMGGIACVATYPEYRGRGLVRRLMQAAFEEMHEDGRSVSMLAPFKQSFYAMFGYVPANPMIFLEVPNRCFEKYRHLPADDAWTFHRVAPADGRVELHRFMEEVAPGQYHGAVLYDRIPDGEWQGRTRQSTLVFVRRNGRTAALARLHPKGFMETGELSLGDMYWGDLPARDRLFQFISLHWDQAYRIKFRVPFTSNFYNWFSDPHGAFTSMIPSMPWMVRIMDPVSAFADIPVRRDGRLTVHVTDDNCPWNSGILSLTASNGRLAAERSGEHPAAEITMEGLSALLYGTARLDELVHRGDLPALDPGTASLLSDWFPPLPIYTSFDF